MTHECASCATTNPSTAKFCVGCGSPLARVCPACGHPAVPGRFCAECGSPLGAAVGPAAQPAHPAPGLGAPVSERRTTTVLFADLVSFTTLAEGRDPEDVRELLSAYFARARTVVGRYGGTIEKFIGDAVMAVWGVPVSHEDDAERAVRAGLDLVGEVAALGASVGAPDLALRVGVVTGSVAVTLGAVGEGMVAGDAVNTAARVQATAAAGAVWVDQETRGLTAAALAYSDMGEHVLKGKAEPVRLHRADAVVAAVGGAQRVDGLEAPLTGRDAELRRVKELFHATQADGRARVVVVSGVAGVGKSRLGWEFEKYTDGLSDRLLWHRGRSLSYGDGVSYWAFAEMVRSRLGIVEGDPRAEVEDKLRDGIDRYAADQAQAAWWRPRLAALLGTGEGTVFERSGLFAAWTSFLERVGGEDPVALVFEDTQHADRGLLDLVEHLLESFRGRLFVLVLTRPELLAQRPSLVAGRRATVVELEPLSEPDMGSLVDALVADLPAPARTAVVARAEGIPLYAVETVRSLIDRDAVVAEAGRYVFVDHDQTRVDLARLAAPTSLQTLIAARLDALTPGERRTVQDASVLGLTFHHSGLQALSDVSGYELDQALESLVRKGVLATQTDPRSPERGQFRFLQALVREVAYGTLARRDRRTRHLAAAAFLERESLEETGGDEVDGAVAGVVAQHLVDALAATGADDPERGALAAQARALLVSSAARAEALGSPEEALRATLSALELGPHAEESAELHERAARVAVAAGVYGVADGMSALAYEGYRALGCETDLIRVALVQARSMDRQGRQHDSQESVQTGLDLVEAHPGAEPRAEIQLLDLTATHARSVGDLDLFATHTLRMLRLAEENQEPDLLLHALNTLSTVLTDVGSRTASAAVLKRAVEIGREQHLPDVMSRSLNNLFSDAYAHDLAAAAALGEETTEACRRAGNMYHLETLLVNCAFTWWLAGDWDRLLTETTAWLETHEPTTACGALWFTQALVRRAWGETPDEPVLVPPEDPWDVVAASLAVGLAAVDEDPQRSAEGVAEAAVAAFGTGDYLEDLEVFWGPAVELQLAAGDLPAAERVLALGEPLLGGRGSLLARAEHPRLRAMISAAAGRDPEADFRAAERAHAAYGAPYLLARTRLELGRWLHGQGRVEEATTLLAQARPVFDGLGAAPSVAEVDAVLSPSPLTVV